MRQYRAAHRAKELEKFGQRQDYARAKADPEKWRQFLDRGIKHRKDVRAKAIYMYGGKCECCGETEIVFLVFDHVGGGGQEHRKQFKPIYKFYRWLVATGERRDKIRILCHNCNFATRYGETCPHQVSIHTQE